MLSMTCRQQRMKMIIYSVHAPAAIDIVDVTSATVTNMQEMATFTWTRDQTKESVSVKDDTSGRTFLKATHGVATSCRC